MVHGFALVKLLIQMGYRTDFKGARSVILGVRITTSNVGDQLGIRGDLREYDLWNRE